MSKAFVHENTGLGGKVLVFMPFLHENHRSGGIPPPPDLRGRAPGINKSSSDDRPCRDFCLQKLERRKGRGVLRGSAPGIKNKPHKNAEPSQKHKTLI